MAVTELPDLAAVARWMDGEGLPGGQIHGARLLTGGTQNLLVRFDRGDAKYVLRRGPAHLRAGSNDAMRREMRVLAALASTDVPHPRLIAACPDEAVLGGAAFYLMEPVDGFNATVTLPEPHATTSCIRHAMGFSAVDTLAALGALDPTAVALGDLGQPTGFLERQVPRWLDELASYESLEGYPGAMIPGVDDVAAWLEKNRPTNSRPGIAHGDYHLANLMYRYDGPGIAAIVDWEMATVGDPLLDLGWLLATWPTPGERSALGPIAAAGGLPRPEELIARYALRSDRDLSSIVWYEVLACFKLGIVLEGTHARACAGKASSKLGDFLHATTLALFARAEKRIHGG